MFPILQNKIMLSSCSQSAMATNVLGAFDEYKNSLLTDGMDWVTWMDKVNNVKAKFAEMIHCDPSEVAILSSVSDCISSVLNAMDLDGKEVLATELDFPCIGQSMLAQQHKQKFTVNFIKYDNNYTIPLDSYEKHLTKNTALTCIPHVSYYSGFKQDLKEVSDVVHAHDSLLFVDAYQSAGNAQIDVKAMNIDILVTGMQKYLLGIPGIALMYINKEIADQLQPTTTGWFGQVNPFEFNLTELKYAASTQRFNTGTPPIVNAYVADEALHTVLKVGVPEIEAYLNELSAFGLETAEELGLTVYSPTDISMKAPCTAIYVGDAAGIEAQMKERDIIVSARKDVIRIAPHFYNTKADVAYALETLKELLSTNY